MHKSILPFDQVPQLSKFDMAYASGAPSLEPFYRYKPEMASFDAILEAKSKVEYPREDLVWALQQQYKSLPAEEKVNRNIEALEASNTFTLVTAHQPSLFLGPLYFIYKALTVINTAESLESRLKGKYRIVPVFVLGSEDHDVEEVNKIQLFGKQIVWSPEERGAVGSMKASSVQPALEALSGILGEQDAARRLFERVEKCYKNSGTFAEATQALLHEFFAPYGLVVLNMNEPGLKKHFIPHMRAELLNQTAFSLVNDTISQLTQLGFKPQAVPREINLFYLQPGIRERIVLENGVYKVLNTDLEFTQPEIIRELEQHPERFSPNVVLRPLYQELILPNLAYVGGGGELAYWLERKSFFEHSGIIFPMLIRRHSVLWLDRDTQKKLAKFGFTPQQFFADSELLVRQYIAQHASGEVSLELEIKQLKAVFDQIAAKSIRIDPTLEKAVLADAVKAESGLEQWQSRLHRAEKQKHETVLNQIRSLKEKLFPGNGLQERTDNFLPYVLKYGDDFIRMLKDNFEPFDPGFLILEEE